MPYFYATSNHAVNATPYEAWEAVTYASTSTRTLTTGNGSSGTVTTEQTLAVTTSADSLWTRDWDYYTMGARVPAVSWTTTTWYPVTSGTTASTTSTYEPPPVTYAVQAQPWEMLYHVTGTGFVQALTDIASTLGYGASTTCEKLLGGIWTTTYSTVWVFLVPPGEHVTSTVGYWIRSGGTATAMHPDDETDMGTAYTTYRPATVMETWTQPVAVRLGTQQAFTTRTTEMSGYAQSSRETGYSPDEPKQVTTMATLGLEGPQSACILSTYASTVPVGTRTAPFYNGEGSIVSTGTVWRYTRSRGSLTAHREYPAWGWQMPNAMGPDNPHYTELDAAPYGVPVVGLTSTDAGGQSAGKRGFLAMQDYTTVWDGSSFSYAVDSTNAARYAWTCQEPPATTSTTGTGEVTPAGTIASTGRPSVAGVPQFADYPYLTAGAGDTVQWARGIYAMWTSPTAAMEVVTYTAPVSTVLTAPIQAYAMEYWDVISYSGLAFYATTPLYVVLGYADDTTYTYVRPFV